MHSKFESAYKPMYYLIGMDYSYLIVSGFSDGPGLFLHIINKSHSFTESPQNSIAFAAYNYK